MTYFANLIANIFQEQESEFSFDTLKGVLNSKHLIVKWYNNYFIVSYPKKGTTLHKALDLTDPVIRECRGLIAEKEYPFKIVCKGFDMFHELDEIPEESLSDPTTRITMAIDGSYMRLYYNEHENKWNLATNRCIDAKKARWQSYKTFYDYFQDASHPMLDYSRLDKKKVYLFVLCHPENRIVKNYNKAKIYHIGTFDGSTDEWKETTENIGIPTPQVIDKTQFKGQDIRTIKSFIDTTFAWDCPGYVYQWQDKDGTIKRALIRNENYEYIKELKGNNYSIVEHYLNLRNDGDNPQRFIDFIKYFPEYSVIEDTLNMVARTVHYQYMEYYIRKTTSIIRDKRIWRILTELHTRYIRTREATTLDIVQQYIRNMSNKDLAKLVET